MITFTTVTKRFGTGAPALEDLSFHVEKGEFVFLTGPSGSGKSTLLKLLTKEYSPTSGDVEFDGKSLNKMKGSQVHHHRRKIGVVFQDYRLLPDLNVWENIALALEISGRHKSEIEERVTDLLELIQLTDRAYHFPAQLSGGEAQRVGIARALATAPTVLLADEPTGNLDPQTTQMIARLFNKIHELGTTIFFATHDHSILALIPHRHIHLEKGKLISDTPGPEGKAKKVEQAGIPTTQKSESQPAESISKSPEPIKEPVASLGVEVAEKPANSAVPPVSTSTSAPTLPQEKFAKSEIPVTVPSPSIEPAPTQTTSPAPEPASAKPRKKTRLSLPSFNFGFFKKKSKEVPAAKLAEKETSKEVKPVAETKSSTETAAASAKPPVTDSTPAKTETIEKEKSAAEKTKIEREKLEKAKFEKEKPKTRSGGLGGFFGGAKSDKSDDDLVRMVVEIETLEDWDQKKPAPTTSEAESTEKDKKESTPTPASPQTKEPK